MKGKIVKTQAELDEAVDFDGRVIIKFGTPYNRAIVRRAYKYSVVAWGNSSVEAWENSSVEARGNVQICDRSIAHTLTVGGNARIVYDPRDIKEYIDFYGLKETEETAFLFKAVHKRNGKYVSDYNSGFEYTIGAEAEADGINTDTAIECGRGIHMAYAEWCVAYGKDWGDLAILELEVEKSSVIVPFGGGGKVRALKVKVVREVPLTECGLLGKRLANRKGKKK